MQPWQINQQASQQAQQATQQAQQASRRASDGARTGMDAARRAAEQAQRHGSAWYPRRSSRPQGAAYRAAATLVKLAVLAGILYAGYILYRHW